MKTSFLVAFLLFVHAFSVQVFSAQLPSPGSNTSHRIGTQPTPAMAVFYACEFTVPKGPSYVNETLIHVAVGSQMVINQAWFEHIRATYGLPFEKADRLASGCLVLNTNEPAAQRYITQLEQWAKAGRHDVIRINWIYTPGSTPAAIAGNAAPASTAPPAAAAQTAPSADTRYVLCSAMADPKNAYFSAPFTAQPPDGSSWAGEFASFLKQKYNYQGYVSCNSFRSLAEAVAAVNSAIRSSHQPGATQSIVQTGWVPTLPAPAAAPAVAPTSSVQPDPCTSSQSGNRRLIPGCGAAPTVSYVVCSASDASATAYVSATFQVTAMDNPGWTNGFAQFLAQKYGYKGGSVGCNNLHEDAAQTFLKGRVIGLRANGKTVVETGWTFASAPAVAVAAAPPITTSGPAPVSPAPARAATPAAAVAAPDKPVQAARYAVCFGIMGPPAPSLFFSDPFQVTAPRTKVWSDAFREMLQQKYQFVGTISCGIRGATLEAAQRFALTEKNSSRGGRKMVDTGWKFQE